MHIIILQKINMKDEEGALFDGNRGNLLVGEGAGGLLDFLVRSKGVLFY